MNVLFVVVIRSPLTSTFQPEKVNKACVSLRDAGLHCSSSGDLTASDNDSRKAENLKASGDSAPLAP